MVAIAVPLSTGTGSHLKPGVAAANNHKGELLMSTQTQTATTQEVVLQLTPEQQVQIKQATGKTVTALTLTANQGATADAIIMEETVVIEY
jgi:hypothetical protein